MFFNVYKVTISPQYLLYHLNSDLLCMWQVSGKLATKNKRKEISHMSCMAWKKMIGLWHFSLPGTGFPRLTPKPWLEEACEEGHQSFSDCPNLRKDFEDFRLKKTEPMLKSMESSGRKSKGGFRFAIDRGGTFTDVFAHCPNGKIRVLKLLSSDPENYNDAPVSWKWLWERIHSTGLFFVHFRKNSRPK